MSDHIPFTSPLPPEHARRQLVAALKANPPGTAAALLARTEDRLAVEALAELNPAFIQDILAALPTPRRENILDSASVELARQWRRNQIYPGDTLGRLMEPAYARWIFCAP